MISQLLKLYSILDQSTKRGLVGLFVMMAFAVLSEMIGISLFIPLLNLLVDNNETQVIPLIGNLIDKFSMIKNPIIFVSIVLIIFFIVKNLLLGLFIYYQNRFIYRTVAIYSCNLLEMYLTRPYAFHLHRNTADLTRNLTGLVGSMFSKTMLPVLQLVLEILTALGILTVMLLAQPLATITIAVILSLSVSLFYYIVSDKVHIWGRRVAETDAKLILWINQSMGSVKDIIISGRHKYFRDSFSRPCFEGARYQTLTNTIPSLPRLFIEVVVIGSVLVTILILLVILNEPVEAILPTLGLFGVAAMRIMPAFGKIVSNLTLIKENTVAIEILYDDFRYLTHQSEADLNTMGESPAVEEITFKDVLRLENVSYRYPKSDLVALSNVTVNLPQGISIAIVGRSGAGKTTLVDMMLGLFAPDMGKITADGEDIFGNISNWRRRIGYIPQDIYILDDTLRRNIALGVEDDDIDDAKIDMAVKLAQLERVVAQQPNGLDTVVGERGARLSGGQRQRIGIARALYENPEVLVMDEATSALDGETEKDISEALTTLAGDKTIVIIAHRLSTVRHCDLLILMDQGRVRATGSFDEMAAQEPEFFRMIEIASIKIDGMGGD